MKILHLIKISFIQTNLLLKSFCRHICQKKKICVYNLENLCWFHSKLPWGMGTWIRYALGWYILINSVRLKIVEKSWKLLSRLETCRFSLTSEWRQLAESNLEISETTQVYLAHLHQRLWITESHTPTLDRFKATNCEGENLSSKK